MPRPLSIIPIIHTPADLGSLAHAHRVAAVAARGEHAANELARRVEAFWDRVDQWAQALQIHPGRVFIYQDGLPICPVDMPAEMRIIDDLARAGSRNHAILQQLAARGASVVGTEPPDLLRKELQLARAIAAGPDPRHAQRARTLLELRDRAIADRIDSTLPADAAGLLFIGSAHNVAPLLPADIIVTRPLDAPATTNLTTTGSTTTTEPSP